MCGRFALLATGTEIAETFALSETPQLAPRYNIAPTQPVAAIRLHPHSGQREWTHLHWGLIPSWAKDPKMAARMINARSETAVEKPAFRAAFKRRRCLIPASGFYEWQKTGSSKQPMYIHPTDAPLFALAGLWETWQIPGGGELDSCTILTTTPNSFMQTIHDRMPVILEPADFDMWLEPGLRPEDSLHLLRPFPPEKMAAYPVSTFVNSPRNDGPDCIAPLG
jgi:putative SOS response-associated peptidase YedK